MFENLPKRILKLIQKMFDPINTHRSKILTLGSSDLMYPIKYASFQFVFMFINKINKREIGVNGE